MLRLIALALLLSACAPAVEQRFESPAYAVHTAMWWSVTDEPIAEVQTAQAMGFGWVKQNFAWRDIEDQKKGHYNTYRPDRIVDDVEAAGLQLLIRIDRPPQWALPEQAYVENGPPADYDDFGDFCFWLADRYRGRVAAYQVWNEPNLNREWGWQTPDPAAYVQLLANCAGRIREADPEAIVISAGLAPTGTYSDEVLPDDIFLQQMYEMGAADYFDVLGLNASGYKAPPDVDPEVVADPANGYGGHRVFAFRHVEDMRRIMVDNGDEAKQIAILEMGWLTDDVAGRDVQQSLQELHPGYAWYAVDAETQAAYLVQAYQYARDHWQPWIGLMTTIYIADINWTPEQHEQWWWSIVLPDGTPRPAYAALKEMEK